MGLILTAGVVLGVASVLACGPRAAAVVFAAHYTDMDGQGFYDQVLGQQRRTAFEYALSIWESRIPDVQSANIDVYASFDSMGGDSTSAVLGSGGPSSFVSDFAGGRSGTAYPSALANYLTGGDLNGANPDIEVTFNSDIDGGALGASDWYYGLDLRPSHGSPDFVTVALHELTHSMGFISTAMADGSFGIGVEQGGTLPDVFDRYLVNSLGYDLLNLPRRASNVTRATYWSGTLGVQEYQKAFGQGEPPLYSPPQFSDASSLSHLDESRFVDQYDLMTPFLSNAIHVPDDVVRGIMADIGWQSAEAGDTNLSGRVDVMDLVGIVSRLGTSYGDSGYLITADINGDGMIDARDLTLAESQFGQTGLLGDQPVSKGFAGISNARFWSADSYRLTLMATVPEPVTIVMLALGVGMLLAGRSRAGQDARG